MKIIKKNSTENCNFYSHEKSLYIARTCLRNVMLYGGSKRKTPMQYTAIFMAVKMDNFQVKTYIFLIFA